MQRAFRIALMMAAFLWSVGCAPNSRGRVSGTVTYREKPVPTGTVTFYVLGAPPYSAPILDGRYEVVDVLPGEAIVTVFRPTANVPPDASNAKKTDKNEWPPRRTALAQNLSSVPIKYADADSTPLRFTVEKGDNTINIKLED
jgi:hypothetical protein